jgi:hypothetical protein
MAQFREWIHTSAISKPYKTSTLSSGGNPASWTSEEDTESESEQSFRSFECRRKKPCAMRQHMARPLQPAAPVMIPSRTHDFGWCDRDESRAELVACACGNDCEEFFSDNSQPVARATSSPHREAPSAEDEFIFDMEM